MTRFARALARLLLVAAAAGWSERAPASTDPDLAWASGPTVVAARAREVRDARGAGDAGEVCEALCRLALARIDVGDLETAEKDADEALAIARSAGDLPREARAIGVIGDAWYYRGDFEKAARQYGEARRIFLEAGDPIEAARQFKNLGIVYRETGRWEEAADALDSAARVFLPTPHHADAASALENLGRVYLSLGDPARAYPAFRDAVALARRTGEARPLGHALLRFSTLYLEEGFYDRALPPLREALAIFEHLDSDLERTWVRSLIAEALFGLGHADEAIALEEQTVASERGAPYTAKERRFARLGELLVDRDPALARDYLTRAKAGFAAERDAVEWWLEAGLARAESRLGDLDRAVDAYERAIGALESERNRLSSERYRASYFRRNQSVYGELVEILWRRRGHLGSGDDAERAFALSERAKGRGLAEAIRESRTSVGSSADPELELRERAIRDAIVALERRLLDPPPGTTRDDLLEQLDQKESELALLVSEMRRRDPRTASLLYPEPISADRARAGNLPGTALLAYFEGDEHLFAFLVTAEGLRFLRLDAHPAVVSARVRNYLELLAEEDGAPSAAIGRRLYADLVAPIAPLVPAGVRDLVIAPDGALSFLPFEALHDGERWVLERWNVAYVPSATVLMELREQPAAEAGKRADLLMFANPSPPAAFRSGAPAPFGSTRALYESEGLSIPPIPYSGVEARLIRRLVDDRSRVYLGDDATEGRVKHEALSRFHVVHFATHGFVSQRWPARSALLLAQGTDGAEDGLLTVPEICRLRLESELVVLSACKSARGPVFAGDGVQGLARAFLHAGSRAVLASLWDVDDDRTAVLMSRFYEQLEAGRTKAEALRAAKLSMIRDASTAAPRYWAGFILSGDATGPIALAGRAWFRSPWVPAAGAAALLVLGWWIRSRQG